MKGSILPGTDRRPGPLPEWPYLYDYEAISDDSETNRPRAFPCSEFTLRRHKTESYVAEIRCRGSVLEPEVMAPPSG